MKQPSTRSLLFLASAVFSVAIGGCNKKKSTPADTALFDTTPSQVTLSPFIPEASGIADSKRNPGYLWVEEDSGNPTDLALVNHTGALLKMIHLKDAINTDWEDISLATGPDAGINYLYIGDIGDNNANRSAYSFYRLEEPLQQTDTVKAFDEIRYQYADGTRDAEAFLVDDATKDIYIITKRETNSRIYKLTYPYSTTAMNSAVFVTTLPYNLVVSAAISDDGKQLLIKTYTNIYYYSRAAGQSIAASLQQPLSSLPYTAEPQGEAIAFSNTGAAGFFTLSEMGAATTQQLFFYGKK